MNCDNFKENIIFYLDKELSHQETEKFVTHLQSCSDCRKVYNEVSKTYLIIEYEKCIPDDPFFYHKLTTRIASGKQIQHIFMQVFKPLAVAASIALGIMIGNGELAILDSQEEDMKLATENIGLVLPADYSMWATLSENDGTEN